MNPSQLTDLIFSTEHILLILFVFGYFLIRALFTCPASMLEAHRARSSRAIGVHSERSVALVPKAKTHRREGSPSKELCVSELLCRLPEDICGRVACYTAFQGVGSLSGCCKKLQFQVWESREVWMALAASKALAITFPPSTSGEQARDMFRRAAFCTDLSRLRSLAAKGRSQPILEEAAHVACGLLPGDLSLSDLADFIQIGTRCLGAHDPESPAANQAAERLLRASRRCMELFTEEQLEHLEYAHKSVHQLHALMLSSMRDSYEGLLEHSLWTGPPDPDPADALELKELFELYNDDCT